MCWWGQQPRSFFACVRGLQARSLWALLRPLPGKPFPNGWDFCVEACVPQDRDRFVFGDFVVVIAPLLDGLDECGELLLVDHGLFSFGFGWGHGGHQMRELPNFLWMR